MVQRPKVQRYLYHWVYFLITSLPYNRVCCCNWLLCCVFWQKQSYIIMTMHFRQKICMKSRIKNWSLWDFCMTWIMQLDLFSLSTIYDEFFFDLQSQKKRLHQYKHSYKDTWWWIKRIKGSLWLLEDCQIRQILK